MYRYPIIPESIVVHLGNPDSNARNIRVNFVEYIKNVASGELYPNWPEKALRANILAIISFALNRVYTEWYRARGYNFDITSSSAADQSFQEGRQFFDRIYVIVDEIFNNYIVRDGQVQPLFASYCDGRNTTCSGLSQWGSVTDANNGLDPLAILKKYYGNNIKIVTGEVEPLRNSFPGKNLVLGDALDDIRLLKIELNRIGQNYPAIPSIINDTIFYDKELEDAVKVFQKTFSLPVTGEVNSATWYKIKYYYNAVKKISSIYSEGVKLSEVELKYPKELKIGSSGIGVVELNYYMNAIACYDDSFVMLDGDTFSKETENNIKTFQRKYGLVVNGEVDVTTWNRIREVYMSYIKTVPKNCMYNLNEFYSGRYMSIGMSGEDVLNLQKFLYLICESTHEIPGVKVNKEYDSLTEQSIKYLQKKFNLNVTGVVNATTWKAIIEYQKKISTLN